MSGHLAVVKLRATDGAVLWRYEPRRGAATGLAVAGSDVVVSGPSDSFENTVVAKLSGATGDEIWSASVSGAPSTVTVDAAGDVVVTTGAMVAKLSGSDGAEVWRHAEPGDQPIPTTQVDAAGDVVVGWTPIVELSATTGEVLWTQDTAPDSSTYRILLDAIGDVVASLERTVHDELGETSVVSSRLVKLSGATGRTMWKRPALAYPKVVDVLLTATASGSVLADHVREYSPQAGSYGRRHTIIALRGRSGRRKPGWAIKAPVRAIDVRAFVDVADDVYVVSIFTNLESSMLTKLRGRTGTPLWAHMLSCGGQPFVARSIVVRGADVFAGGFQAATPPEDRFAVVELSAETGAE